MVGAALNKAKVATQSFGGALKATGIGLFVAAIGGLVAAFSQNENAMKKFQPLLIGLQRIFNGVLKAVEPLFDVFLNLATQALPYVSKAFSVVYSSVTAVFQSLGKLGSAVVKLIKGDFSGAWADAKESVNSFSKNYEQANTRFISGTKEVTAIEQGELNKRAVAREKSVQDQLALEKEAQELLIKQYEEYLKRREFANKNSGIVTQDEIKKLNQEDADEKKKADDAELNENVVKQTKAIGLYKNGLYSQIAAQKEASDASAKIVEADRNMRVNAALDIADAMISLGSIVGEQTMAGKALGVASALINTYVGASEVIRAKSVLPEPFGTIQKIASVAAIIATGLKTVRTITAVQVPGGGGGGSMPSMPSISAPLMPQVSTTTLNQAQVNQIGNVAARAFVVESDVTGNQERIQRLNRAARIN